MNVQGERDNLSTSTSRHRKIFNSTSKHLILMQLKYQMSFRVVRNEVMSVAAEGNAAPPALPEDQPISNSRDQQLVQQLAETIKVIGDRLNQEKAFNESV